MHTFKMAFATVVLAGAASSALGQLPEVTDAPVLQAGANEAIVYFVRPRRIGGAINSWSFIDDIPIGMTRARVRARVKLGLLDEADESGASPD